MNKLLLSAIVLFLFLIYNTLNNFYSSRSGRMISPVIPLRNHPSATTVQTVTPKSEPTLPQTYVIGLKSHVFQTFNNCGPASLSMLLSYFGITISQKELGDKLRPYQIPRGDNDDKSVTMEELSRQGESYNLVAYHRPNGTLDILKQLIAADLPVMVRTWTKPGEDIGHYRIIRGFDDSTVEIIQDDSLQNKNLRFSYDYFINIWKGFNNEYLVLVPTEKKNLVEAILGEDTILTLAWIKAVQTAQKQTIEDENDIYAHFNLSVALFHTGNFQKSVEEFEKVENLLPFRTLWYLIEPIEAYMALGNYQKVIDLTNKILKNDNRAFSELYLLRGEIYKIQGNTKSAQAEFDKAHYYNKNMQAAKEALENFANI